MSIRKRKHIVQRLNWFKRIMTLDDMTRLITLEYHDRKNECLEKQQRRQEDRYDRWSLKNFRKYRKWWSWSAKYNIHSPFQFKKFMRRHNGQSIEFLIGRQAKRHPKVTMENDVNYAVCS